LLLILIVVAHIVVEGISGGLEAADSVAAITGVALLAIGHGVCHCVHYLRLRATMDQSEADADNG
jgi:hypothetical protein